MKKMALEGHLLHPGFEEYWAPTVCSFDRDICDPLPARLRDFGGLRLDAMDQAGIKQSKTTGSSLIPLTLYHWQLSYKRGRR
jgi:hypothetical protein